MDLRIRDLEWVDQIKPLGMTKSYKANDPVHFQGEKAATIGIVLSGKAKASVYSEDGQETWIGKFETGDFLGHAAILTDSPINFEITAETKLDLLQIPTGKFREFLSSDHQLAKAVTLDLAERLNMMTDRLVEAITLSAPGRICAELIRMSKPVGVAPDKLIIRPNPVFVDLALYVNSTRETVSRTVNGLLKEGIVSREAGAILIHNPERLKSQIR